jgi:hypothetical protein
MQQKFGGETKQINAKHKKHKKHKISLKCSPKLQELGCQLYIKLSVQERVEHKLLANTQVFTVPFLLTVSASSCGYKLIPAQLMSFDVFYHLKLFVQPGTAV